MSREPVPASESRTQRLRTVLQSLRAAGGVRTPAKVRRGPWDSCCPARISSHLPTGPGPTPPPSQPTRGLTLRATVRCWVMSWMRAMSCC